MKVLVVGGGGREHALCASLARREDVDHLFAAPGNAGMAEMATLIPISAGDVEGLVEFAERESIDLTVVGPEAPLVAGLADEMTLRGLPVFGPTSDAARLEGSKAWAKDLCRRHGIPTAGSEEFEAFDAAMAYVEQLEPPIVVKVDGLAAGKGVTVAEDHHQAEQALRGALVNKVFGEAGLKVLVEEYLTGMEVSALALTDGMTVRPLALAQDFKRAMDGNRGQNTGGMGAFSPLPFVGGDIEARITVDILEAVGRALRDEGVEFRGVLFAGVMLTDAGPRVLEFNCRFGDPETQVILPRLTSDLAGALRACTNGTLADHELTWTPQACVGVVVASAGYPGPVQSGRPIAGLESAAEVGGVQVFHSGTSVRDGQVVTSGGRVLTVTALGSDQEEARARAYEACSRIRFDGITYRRDIARVTGGVRIEGTA